MGVSSVAICFIENVDGSLFGLEVEAPRGLVSLSGLYRALRELGVQIVHASARPLGATISQQFRVVEFDGTSITAHRRRELQVQIFSLVGS